MDSSKKEAIANNNPTYKTGLPCKYGHFSERSTTSGNCIECYSTTYKDSRRKYQASRNRSQEAKMTKLNNKASIASATNQSQRWTIKDISLACQKDSKGNYIKTCEQVAALIGRSIKAVEKCRMRYRAGWTKKCKPVQVVGCV